MARYLTRWLTAVIEPDLEPATYAYYETMARLYVSPALGSIRLDLLQAGDVQAWLDQLPRVCQCCAQGKDAARPPGRQRCCAIGACCHRYPGRRTVQAARDTLRAALNHAQTSDHLVPRNVAAFATVPSPRWPRREGPAWTAVQACRFLASACADGDPFCAAYVLVLACALSKAEVLGLTWPSVNLDSGELDTSWQFQRVGGQLIHRHRAEADDPDAGFTLPMPGICALASDRLIAVVRRWVQASDPAAQTGPGGSAWRAVGGLALWMLRLIFDVRGTLAGFRHWVLAVAPVAPGIRAVTPPAAGQPQALPAGDGSETDDGMAYAAEPSPASPPARPEPQCPAGSALRDAAADQGLARGETKRAALIRGQIRPCWPNHPEARWELAWLYQLWTHAYLTRRPAPKDAADWHDRWTPGVIHRLSQIMRRCEEACQRQPSPEVFGQV